MKRILVESSNLASVGYDADRKILEIEFAHGGVYQYFEVEPEVYEQLMNADSHGSYFNGCIRGAYRYTQLAKQRRRRY